ncbi:hypothetical protein BKA93DRAFT_493219 [Sparassis latifolia]
MIHYPNLKPTLFEASSSLGGIWSTDHPYHRPLMTTNICRHTCLYSDVPWPADAGPKRKDLFRYSGDMGNFLNVYAQRYLRDGDVRMNTKVTKVDLRDGKWALNSTVVHDGNETPQPEEAFDYLITATGFFSNPYIPALPGLDASPFPVEHSAVFRDPDAYRGKSVAVVGGSLSAVEIAGALSPYAAKIHHITPAPFYVNPLFVPTTSENSEIPRFAPWDLDSYRRAYLDGRRRELINPTPEDNRKKHSYFASLFPKNILPNFNFDTSTPPQVGFSELYRGGIQTNVVKTYLARLESIDPEAGALVLSNGERIYSPDFVILCTGYSVSFPYLTPSALEAISYQHDNHSVPFLTHRLVLHPDLPKAGFVGVYRGSYYGVIEIQARYLAAIFSGEKSWPSEEEMRKGVEIEKSVREAARQTGIQFPHGDYAGLFESYAALLDIPYSDEDHIVAANYPLQENEDVEKIMRDVQHADALSSDGAWIPGAVFRSWAGHWKVNRRVHGAMQKELNGQFEGFAMFHMRPPSALPSGYSTAELGMREYLYHEHGVFVSTSGKKSDLHRKYVYRYSPPSDTISVWGVTSDDYDGPPEQGEVEDWLHDISRVSFRRPGPLQEQDITWFVEHNALEHWEAAATEKEVSKLVYKFVFEGAEVTQFGVGYEVHGPEGRYVSEAWFTR